jgi:RNA polymerase sigma-70 factor
LNSQSFFLVTTASAAEYLRALNACADDLDELYARCAAAHPGFTVPPTDFKQAVSGAVDKYLIGLGNVGVPTAQQVRQFIGELQGPELYLALACARGDEHAWWQFDRQYRPFIERIALHLAGRGMDANEVIDSVYVELFGTKTTADERQSKFRTYTGRGTLRGWLRTLIWHTVVDLYRGRQDEISLEDLMGSGGDEILERQVRRKAAYGTEELMLAKVVRERYQAATIAALDQALANLDDHETLLLLYYHVEGLKLREIARIVEEPRSPVRRWFQRQSKRRAQSRARVHESTVMRWLDKIYKKISDGFRSELRNKHGLKPAEIEICVAIATEDLGQSVALDSRRLKNESFREREAENRQAEGAS